MRLYTLTALAAALVAAGPENSCTARYPNKMPFLTTCATATQFCTKYIGGTGNFTTTSTIITGTTIVPASSTTTTLQNTTTTSTTTTTVSTDAPARTIYSPISDIDCGRPTQAAQAKRQQQQPRRSSCGIAKGADPTGVSGACNCFLAHTATTRKNATITSGTATVTEYTISTSTSTSTTVTTTATPTSTQCTSPRFEMKTSNGYILPDTPSGKLLDVLNSLAKFQIKGGVLYETDFNAPVSYVQDPSYGPDVYYAHVDIPESGPAGAGPLNCYIDSQGQNSLRCTTPGGDRPFICGEALYFSANDIPGCQITILVAYLV